MLAPNMTKGSIKKEIADIVKKELSEQGINIDFGDIDMSANSQFFLWHTWFHDVFSRPSKRASILSLAILLMEPNMITRQSGIIRTPM